MKSAQEKLNLEQLEGELCARWLGRLPGAARDEAARLLHALAANWVRRANASDQPAARVAIWHEGLEEDATDKTPEELLRFLRLEVLSRRIDELDIESWELATAVIDQRVSAAAVRPQAEALQAAVEVLKPEVEAVPEPDVRRLRRQLNEVWLEAHFVLEGEEMSLRLGRYWSDRRSSR